MSTDKPLPEAVREKRPVEDTLHGVFTQHGIASRSDLPHELMTDLIGWAADECRYATRHAEAAAQQERARLADYITEDLFTNGSGERADRLVLTIDGPPKRDLGGWGKLPFADRLRDLLASHPPPTPEGRK